MNTTFLLIYLGGFVLSYVYIVQDYGRRRRCLDVADLCFSAILSFVWFGLFVAALDLVRWTPKWFTRLMAIKAWEAKGR